MPNDDTVPKYRILIVDDEREVLLALHTTLKRARQFESDISIAENGSEALAELQKKEFDIILSDYKMPGMNGLELLAKVKEKYPRIVRMLVTACTDIAVAKDAINNVAVDHYIEKPWDRQEIVSLIYDVLERKGHRKLKRGDGNDISDQDLPIALLPALSEKDVDKK